MPTTVMSVVLRGVLGFAVVDNFSCRISVNLRSFPSIALHIPTAHNFSRD